MIFFEVWFWGNCNFEKFGFWRKFDLVYLDFAILGKLDFKNLGFLESEILGN